MTRKTYPICHFCEHPLNPNAEDDCDRVFVLPNGELCCPPCFKDYLLNYGYNNVHFRAHRRIHRRRLAFQNRRHDREEAPP